MPKYSFIIPAYNAEDDLERCLQSVLAQSFADYEVIIINDGSTDRTRTICECYCDLDIRIKLINKQNEGVSKARQNGIDMATGEYLVFVDSDDWIASDLLDNVNQYYGCDIVRYGNVTYGKHGEEKYVYPTEKKGIYSKSEIRDEIFPYLIQNKEAKYYCPSLWSHVIKRKLFVENMLLDKIVKMGEDGACVIPCVYNASSFAVVDKCLYHYCYNSLSATKGKKPLPFDGPEIISKHISEKINILESDFRMQLYRKTVHELFSVIVSQFSQKEKYKTIKKRILEGIDSEFYREAISCAKFSGSFKAVLMSYALKKKYILLCKLYSML